MREGHMSKHLRKIKRIYKKKNTLLVNSFKNAFDDKLNVISSDSGLHIVCEAITEKTEEKLKEDAKNLNILLNIISSKNGKIIFSLNYSGIIMDEIHSFTTLLGKALFQ